MKIIREALGAGLLVSVILSGCGGGDSGGGDDRAASGAVIPPSGSGSSIEVAAQDIAFAPKELSAAAGPVKLTLKNEGAILHTLLFDDVPKFSKLEVATEGATDAGTLDVGPGTYAFYCDQPGHRAAGMEGTLTVG